MQISRRVWDKYIAILRRINEQAGVEMKAFLETRNWQTDNITRQACVDFGYALATKYGEAAGAVACQMYDEVAKLSMALVPEAEPAATATYDEVAKSVIGTMKTNNVDVIAGSISRLVKMAGVDTTMQNALRDGAQWAWIPVGDTCAFCITLASRGWQKASKSAMKGNHAEHIHANCDCTYAIRFDSSLDVAGYDPKAYKAMYNNADPDGSSKDKINAMRREFYAENKEVGLTNPDGSVAEETMV